ncbi:MAG: hypothetical protein H6Q14_387 [Bacteroidetes bacterium]|nr:hypothetical protein [Bacteroidota bacterium]
MSESWNVLLIRLYMFEPAYLKIKRLLLASSRIRNRLKVSMLSAIGENCYPQVIYTLQKTAPASE